MRIKRGIFRSIILIFIVLSSHIHSFGSHLYGGEFYYTYQSGKRYKLTLVVYADCSSTSSALPMLTSATPEIQIYNGSSIVKTIVLKKVGDSVEVTPVCPTSLSATACRGGTVPGVLQYTYSDTLSLDTSANWKFRFTGDFKNTTIAGRSNSLTNIIMPTAGSVMSLEATLNNTVAPNSNPAYTSIPTPFFCLFSPQEYNPGAVDPNTGDSLVYELIPGLDGTSTPSSLVTYRSPYSGTAPLGATTGTFSFNTSTGQLSFTPNLVQQALVVGKVYEYRNGVLVGTSMREMTFIVLSTCNNKSPYGRISNVSAGSASGNTAINICKNEPLLNFNINPSDSDGNKITITASGLPAGMTMSIKGNGTDTPSIAFSWNLSSVAAGTYTFYLIYQDDGCPLSAKQTIAYTIRVLPKPAFSVTQISHATCVRKAVISVTPLTGASPWSMSVSQGGVTLHSISSISSSATDSLSPGIYSIRMTSASGCFYDSTVNIAAPPPIILYNVFVKGPACNNGDDGSISIAATGDAPPYIFALDTGAFSSSGVFTGLTPGTYVVHTRDSNYCVKDTTFNLPNPPLMNISFTKTKAKCRPFANASITFSVSGGIPPYQYSNGTAIYSSSPVFTGLKAGDYTFYVKDSNNCVKSVPVTIIDSFNVQAVYEVKQITCNGTNDGQIKVTPYVGFPPFSYASGTGAYGSSSTFSSLGPGVYVIHTMDVLGCIKDSSISLTEPDTLRMNPVVTDPNCYGDRNGMIRLITAGGTTPYLFALNGGAFAATDTFPTLFAGSYLIQMKDAKGCSFDSTVRLVAPAPLVLGADIGHPACHGEASAVVHFHAGGGTPDYTYAYDSSPARISSTITGLGAGPHQLYLTDAHGCKKDSSIFISEPAQLAFRMPVIVKPTCESYPDGAITIEAVGGTAPYMYAMGSDAFGNNNYYANLTEGSYSFHVRDSNNCLADTVFSLSGYPHILFNSSQVTSPSCYGRSDGAFTMSGSGGNMPLRYTLEGTTDTLDIGSFSQLPAGTYTVIITDRTNCHKEARVTIAQPDQLTLEPVVTPNFCYGLDTNGAVSLVIKGGTGPYSFLWSTGSREPDIHGLPNGNYAVRVNDVNNCSDSLTAEVAYDNCCKPVIPNAFSPNSDGKNDIFYIIYKGDIVLREFSIYNRYGQQVFTTSDITQGWDGYFHGERLEIGSYYYYIRLICGNKLDHEVSFKGDITLVR